MTLDEEPQADIDAFVAESQALNGQEYRERPVWNRVATLDAIHHFCRGTCDLNPLWVDPDYGIGDGTGLRLAPPAFLTSVLYPVLHGARRPGAMANLIGDLGFTWVAPIIEGDQLRATSRQTDVREGRRRDGRRFVCIASETTYWNQRDVIVARANATVVWVEVDGGLLIKRDAHRYSPAEIEEAMNALRAVTRRGTRPFEIDEVAVGREIPALVHPPLTIVDLIAWQTASGPAQEPGARAALSAAKSSRSAVIHPLTGWPIHTQAQHEDPVLSRLRGLPLPFDNGAMRFAWLAPLLTNWIGDWGVLERLQVQFKQPILYGDVTRYSAVITRRTQTEAGVRLDLRVRGINQLGAVVTTATAAVLLPPESFKEHRAGVQEDAPTESRSTAGLPSSPEPEIVGSVESMFEIHARRAPDAVAVSCGDEQLSYGELNRRADRLAHDLSRAGVGPGVRVAVFLERQALAIVAMLAVAKTGATRVCLDPTYSGNRLRGLLEAVGAMVLLVGDQSSATDPARLPIGTRVIRLGTERLAGSSERIEQRAGDDDLAYILFTSGSVTAPKAVAVSRAALGRSVCALGAELGVGPQDRYLHSASFSFSASERQLWLPLCHGATLVLARRADRADPMALLETLRASGITIWDTVPSWLRWSLDRLETVAASRRNALSADLLRLVLVTGEPLPWTLAARWLRHPGHRGRLINLYSQTETTGTTCLFRVDEVPEPAAGLVPIGRPVRGTRVYVLGPDLAPVPAGDVGEICIAGDRLASGYAGQEESGSARWVANPFESEPGTRLYRSGDLGRMRSDGILEFVGRADDRIKLRGFRIEPAQIVAALLEHPAISDATVAVADAEDRLVAYLVARDGDAVGVDELRSFLVSRLPSYMVPTATVWLPRLPRTASGKVDRAALPPPPGERPQLAQAMVSPADEVERLIAEVWAETLGLSAVGVDDDFFDLGGDSMLAVSAIIEIERRLGRSLSIDWLYDASTVRSFTRRAEFSAVSREASCVFPLRTGSESEAVFFASGGGGHLFNFRRLAELLGGDESYYGLQLPGLSDESEPLDRIDAIAAEFLRQIRRVQPANPLHLVGYSFGGLVVYEMARQLAARGEAVGLVGLLDTPGPDAFHLRSLRRRLGFHFSTAAALGAGDQLRYFARMVSHRLRWLRLRSSQVENRVLSPTEQRLRTVREAHLKAANAYTLPPYGGRVWLFRAAPEVPAIFVDADPSYGWSAVCGGGVTVHPITGGHHTLFDEPHVHDLARALRAALVEAQQPEPARER